MRLERWSYKDEEKWEFFRKVASAIAGKDVEVLPGRAPSATRIAPRTYISRVHLPEPFTRPGRERLLNGSLAHELHHVLATDPDAVTGIPFDRFLVANALEDARLLVQLSTRWPGLTRPVRTLDASVMEFRRRSKRLATTAKTSKLFDVGLSLYLRLVGLPKSVVAETVPRMAVLVAEEVFEIARPVLQVRDTFAVVDVAAEICRQLAKAAEAVAKRVGTAAARSWTSSLKRELTRAHRRTVEEILLQMERKKYPGFWWGPWLRGGGSYNWHSIVWRWENAIPDPVEALTLSEVERALLDADPLLEERSVRRRQSFGRLSISSTALVEAVVGCGQRRVFEQVEHRKRMLLPSLLRNTEVFVFLEAHARYDKSEWLFLKDLGASLGRLMTVAGVPLLVVRAATTTRARETVKNKDTGRVFERWSKDHYVEVATLKGPDQPWAEKAEQDLSALPAGKGFNQPLEAYPRMKSWGITLPKSNRPRLYVVLGKVEFMNVHSGHLRFATKPLRAGGGRAIYVNLGSRLAHYDPRRKEIRDAFDGYCEATTLRGTLMHIMREIVLDVAKRRLPRSTAAA